VPDIQKDELLTQFLSMTEDQVDPDVAHNLLEVVGWDVQAAVEQLYGGPMSATAREPSGMALDLDAGAGHGTEIPDVEFIDHEGEGGGRAGGVRGGPGVDEDARLAAAIEASFHAQTHAGREASEEELIAEAMRISQREEDSRQRQSLREQQEAELAESILMDQMREEQAREMRAEEERLARQRSLDVKQAAAERAEQAAQEQAELEAKRARLPEEPAKGDKERVDLLFRLPSGQRLTHAFRSSETVGLLYDYVDSQQIAGVIAGKYHLVSTMPRKVFEDRSCTLTEASIQRNHAFVVETIADVTTPSGS